MAIKTREPRESPVRFGREKPYDFKSLEAFLATGYAPVACRAIHLGCRNGRTSVFLARQGFHVLGIDPDRDLLSAARERAIVAGVELDLMAGDPLALPPLPEECYGLAVDLWTAGVLPDGFEREEYLRRLYRLLMRDGVLIASSPPPRRARATRRSGPFAFASPFVADFTRAGFEVLYEGAQNVPSGETRLVVHAHKPG